jgi:hypothetical protein
MKKIISILFLFIFLFNICGIYFIYILRLSENRNEMKTSISGGSKNDLLELKVPATLIRSANSTFYHTSEDEISYKGKMYDVASSKQNPDGSVTFYCLSDNTEENLNLTFEKQVDTDLGKTSAAGSTTKQKTGIKNFFKDYLPPHASDSLLSDQGFCTIPSFCFLYCLPACFKVPSPPPRQA